MMVIPTSEMGTHIQLGVVDVVLGNRGQLQGRPGFFYSYLQLVL